MAKYNSDTTQETIASLRMLPDGAHIELPKGIAVGLLVGIEDALQSLNALRQRAKTKRDTSSINLIAYNLEMPRDRLLRLIREDEQ